MVDERSGGRILVDALCSHGTSHVFCVPGESYLPVLDALLDTQSIHTVVCRQEGGGAMMADAYGKLTRRPGIYLVTRGPGATNAAAGAHRGPTLIELMVDLDAISPNQTLAEIRAAATINAANA